MFEVGEKMTWWQIENIVPITASVVCVCALYYMSHSWHSLWALMLMLNINTVVRSKK